MDRNTYLISLSERFCNALGDVAFAEQAEPHKVFSAIWDLESQVNNGGFDQYIRNIDSDVIGYAPGALHAIGAAACAGIVERAIEVIATLPATQELRYRALDSQGESGEEQLAALDAEFFAFLEDNVAALKAREPGPLLHAIARSCRLKADVVEHDEYERTGLRAVLNYGHTFAHAFEALSGYGELLHGEAVSIGMVYASQLAVSLGRIDASVTERQVRLIESLGLPIALPQGPRFSIADMLQRMRLDKKAEAGGLRFVLPTRLGHVELVAGVSESTVIDILRGQGHRS